MTGIALTASPLRKELRNQLEKVVKAARQEAEAGVRAVLEQYGVSEPQPFEHLSAEERELRVRLRARARQVGDRRQANGRQEIEHLVREGAYEHWHEMLFARFLAENHLLMHPEGVPVSLEECEELAEEEGAGDGWELASRYAARMLPQIFRPDAPVLQFHLSPECRRRLEDRLESLPVEVFTAGDSLGWVYQFWQAQEKDAVNQAEVKIGADELPAVTQLFTEAYMVDFLLHNSLGAWWVSRHGGEEPPVALVYLRRLEDGTPAAGGFPGWPDATRELRVLDPCCGSGHFLVAAFRLLVPLRMAEEGPAIVCIPPVRGEQTAHVRLQALLAQAYGDQWNAGRLESLLREAGYAGKNLETYLRDGFFEQHCQLFHQRPFIWQIWDGRRDGFAALVNYHRLDRSRLETLTYTYLGDWIRRQEDELRQDIGGAEARLLAVRTLHEKLQLILQGEAPYDIFVRWKPTQEQPIGWEPDLNDGVRLNIRPFVEADVLRKRPKIQWTKDRGKDPESSPWYPLFQGDRINDHHLRLAGKQAVRQGKGKIRR